MPKKYELKTKASSASVTTFLNSIKEERKRDDAKKLLSIFKKVTKKRPKMWGTSIVGFGEYHYTYASGQEGDFLATGFSPRENALTLYIMPGYQDYGHLLKDLGPHKRGRSCLYIKRLEDIDTKVLEALIREGLKDLAKQYPVK